MKALKAFIISIMLIGIFAASDTNAQALVIKDGSTSLGTSTGLWPSVSLMTVETPNGNTLYKAVFIIGDLSDPLVPEKGVNKVPVWNLSLGTVDNEMIVKPNGEAKLIYHINGSGSSTPNSY